MRQKIITSLIILIGFSGGSAWAAGIGGATTGTLPGAIGANGVTSNPGFGTTQGIGGYGTSPGLGNAQTTQQAGTAGNIGTSGQVLNNSGTGGSNFQPGQPEVNGGLGLGNTNSFNNPASNAAIPSAPGTNPGAGLAQPLNPAATQ